LRVESCSDEAFDSLLSFFHELVPTAVLLFKFDLLSLGEYFLLPEYLDFAGLSRFFWPYDGVDLADRLLEPRFPEVLDELFKFDLPIGLDLTEVFFKLDDGVDLAERLLETCFPEVLDELFKFDFPIRLDLAEVFFKLAFQFSGPSLFFIRVGFN